MLHVLQWTKCIDCVLTVSQHFYDLGSLHCVFRKNKSDSEGRDKAGKGLNSMEKNKK